MAQWVKGATSQWSWSTCMSVYILVILWIRTIQLAGHRGLWKGYSPDHPKMNAIQDTECLSTYLRKLRTGFPYSNPMPIYTKAGSTVANGTYSQENCILLWLQPQFLTKPSHTTSVVALWISTKIRHPTFLENTKQDVPSNRNCCGPPDSRKDVSG